jgi:hypothetical protein
MSDQAPDASLPLIKSLQLTCRADRFVFEVLGRVCPGMPRDLAVDLVLYAVAATAGVRTAKSNIGKQPVMEASNLVKDGIQQTSVTKQFPANCVLSLQELLCFAAAVAAPWLTPRSHGQQQPVSSPHAYMRSMLHAVYLAGRSPGLCLSDVFELVCLITGGNAQLPTQASRKAMHAFSSVHCKNHHHRTVDASCAFCAHPAVSARGGSNGDADSHRGLTPVSEASRGQCRCDFLACKEPCMSFQSWCNWFDTAVRIRLVDDTDTPHS